MNRLSCWRVERLALPVAAAFLLAVCLAIATKSAHAADIDLTGDCPSGVGNVTALSTAITTAESTVTTDTITLAANCVYTLTTVNSTDAAGPRGLPEVTNPLTIAGNGSTILRAPTAPAFRILMVHGGVTTLDRLTLAGGKTDVNFLPGDGAGVAIFSGTVILNECTLRDNDSQWAGGAAFVQDEAALVATRCTFHDNSAISDGGAIYSDGSLVLDQTTLSGNSGPRTVSAGGFGSLTIRNSTVANNTDSIHAIFSISSPAILTMSNVLLAGQTESGLIAANPLSTTLSSVLVDSPTGSFTGITVDSTAALLGPLANNGGPTLTHALLSGNAAINGGPPAFVGPSSDQRGAGFPRVQNGRVDVGAVEVQAARLGGTVSNLQNGGLVLALNGVVTQSVAASGPFTLTGQVVVGANYTVTVAQQPVSPPQICSVTNGTGVMPNQNVTNVAVACALEQYTVTVAPSGNGGTVAVQVVTTTVASGVRVAGPAAADAVYPYGTLLRLTATPLPL
ncbi:MAG: choice-of-anchor Q domain-containing protein, partial [Caldilineaceae bacterium]